MFTKDGAYTPKDLAPYAPGAQTPTMRKLPGRGSLMDAVRQKMRDDIASERDVEAKKKLQEELARAEATKRRLTLKGSETAEVTAANVEIADSLLGTEMEELVRSVAEQEAAMKLQRQATRQASAMHGQTPL